MSIGEVLGELRGEFPEVTVSKIRFLESEGLIEPARTPSGYRKFSHADVARLRFVLATQRDHYLPLRVIREHLAAIDRGTETSATSDERTGVQSGAGGRSGPGTLLPGASEVRLTRDELVARAGIDGDLLDQIEGFGLIGPVRGTAGPTAAYDADALAVAQVVAEMTGFGLEPRHLRAFRTAADRESDLVVQVVAPLLRQRSPQARSRAEEVSREMGALSLRLHTALVRARLRDLTGT